MAPNPGKTTIRLGDNLMGQVGPHDATPAESQEAQELQQANQGFPLPVGGVVVSEHLSQHEKEMFDQLGVKPGDRIPSNLADIIDAAKQQAIQQAGIASAPVDPSQPPLKLDVHNIKDLPQEQQEYFRDQVVQALSDFRNQPAPRRAIDPKTMAPGVMGAIQTAQGGGRTVNLDKQTVPPPQSNIVVPPSQFAKSEAPRAPQGAAPGPGSTESQDPPIARPGTPQAASPGPQPAQEPPKPADTGQKVLTEHQVCPYCHFNLSSPPPWEEPGKEDATEFMAALLAQKPYHKLYRMLNDRLSVEFRTLEPAEHDMCFRQLYLEQQAGTVKTLEEFWEKLSRYKMYLQLYRLRLDQNPINLPESVNDWDLTGVDLQGQTPLPSIAQYVTSNVLNTDLLHRLVGKQCGMFNELVQRLEALVQDSDFWQETAG